METTGERIKKCRRVLGLSQADFANKIGISRITLARYESGERQPDAGVLLQISRIFKISIDWLLTGQGEMFIKQEERNEAQELLDELERIRRDYGEEHYRRAIKLAKKLLQDIQTFSESSTKKKAN